MTEELLVFGYSCKLFKDDEKALYIEQGKHLVPWMNDHSLRIDRFDVRGALYDLKEAEDHGGSNILTEGEIREEQVCDHERYLALYHDEQHEILCQEEEVKRLQVELHGSSSGYKQIAFDYDNVQVDEGLAENAEDPVVQNVPVPPESYNPIDDDLFIPPPELSITIGLEVPTSKKQNKVIVKTAQFVVSEGVQMEILLKTKQNGNPMFNFLAFDNCLNAYYKHVVNMIKKGRYRPDEENEEKDQNGESGPSVPGIRPNLTPGVSSPNRPSKNCTYSNLISKIREKQLASAADEADTMSPIAPSSPVDRSSNSTEINFANDGAVVASPPKATFTNPYPIVAQSAQADCVSTPLSGNATPISRNGRSALVGLVDYPSFNQTAGGTSEEDEPVIKNSPVKDAHNYSHIKWPPPDVQMVIDKMASYIIKNGDVFEQTVKSRNDSRFNFLHTSNEYYAYYKCKMELYQEVYGDIFKTMAKQSAEPKHRPLRPSTTAIKSPPMNNNQNGRTISFSIKSRDSENPLTVHSTFPVESSTSEEDEDMADDEKERRRIEREKRREKRRQKLREEKKAKEKEERWRRDREEADERARPKRVENEDEGSTENEDLYDIFKYAQEMSQDKVEDSSPTSVETPKGVTKQSERKRKAAAFLSKLKGTVDEQITYGPDLPPEIAVSLNPPLSKSPTSSSSESVQSIESSPNNSPKNKRKSKSPSPLRLIEGLSVTLNERKTSVPSSPKIEKQRSLHLGLIEGVSANFTDKSDRASRDSSISISIRRSRSTSKETESTSMGSILLKGLKERKEGRSKRELSKERSESRSHKSRSHKKHSRYRSRSRSHSPRRKKRKRSRSRKRKKHRSRSREKKKHRKHKSHRDQKKRKKKRAKTPSSSSSSSLPSSDDSSSDVLPSESDEINIVDDSTPSKEKSQSRSSSVLSVHGKTPERERTLAVASRRTTVESEEDTSTPPLMPLKLLGSTLAPKLSKASLTPLSDSVSRDGARFDPSKSRAMAKIAQGLRAKLNAIFEKESNIE